MDKYERLKKIGKGSFGTVFLCRDKKSGSEVVAKEICIASLPAKEQREAATEIRVLQRLCHPNIIRYFESFEERGSLFIIMEYADAGDLSAYIKNRRGVLIPEQQVLDWFVQITLALKHVHDRKILHRDLKSQVWGEETLFLGSSPNTIPPPLHSIPRTSSSRRVGS